MLGPRWASPANLDGLCPLWLPCPRYLVGGGVRNSSTRQTSKGDPTAKVSAGKVSAKTATPRGGSRVYGFDRLEAAVGALAECCEGLEHECADLRKQVTQRDARVNVLEAELLEANQLRQDVGKRVDELIAQIDLLDGQLESSES